jgi:hypothetical protein
MVLPSAHSFRTAFSTHSSIWSDFIVPVIDSECHEKVAWVISQFSTILIDHPCDFAALMAVAAICAPLERFFAISLCFNIDLIDRPLLHFISFDWVDVRLLLIVMQFLYGFCPIFGVNTSLSNAPDL